MPSKSRWHDLSCQNTAISGKPLQCAWPFLLLMSLAMMASRTGYTARSPCTPSPSYPTPTCHLRLIPAHQPISVRISRQGSTILVQVSHETPITTQLACPGSSCPGSVTSPPCSDVACLASSVVAWIWGRGLPPTPYRPVKKLAEGASASGQWAQRCKPGFCRVRLRSPGVLPVMAEGPPGAVGHDAFAAECSAETC